MYNSILFSVCLLFCNLCTAQFLPSRYWVQFTDKNNTPYTLSDPAAYLSQKAIDRRINQGISIQQNDLPIDPVYTDSIRNAGVKILNRSKWFNAVTIFTNDSSLIDSIMAFTFVKKVEIAGKFKNGFGVDIEKTSLDKWQEEELIANSSVAYNAGNEYGQAYNQISMLGGDILHSMGYRGEGMVIAIMDAGFNNADINPAFAKAYATNRVLGAWDFVNGNDSVYDDGEHGLWVFSIIASEIPGVMVGTAPAASYWLLRTEDTGSEYIIEEDNWVAAAEFADSTGADIITTSLGYSTFDDPSQNHTYQNMDGNTTRITIGADIAASKGILVINAAGNSGSSSWKYIIAPADGDSVLAVGAVDNSGNYASFSSQGPSFDGRVKPNVAAQGLGTVTITGSGGIQSGSGTSFAAPLIAGLSACLWQANPSVAGMEVFYAIQKSASQYYYPDFYLGYGIPNFAEANMIMKDIDEDGVPNVSDSCPGTPYSVVVGKDGCPVNFNIDQFIESLPNPIPGNLQFIYYSSSNQDITIVFFDLTGKEVMRQQLKFDAGSYRQIKIQGVDRLTQGMYLMKISSGENAVVRKLIIPK